MGAILKRRLRQNRFDNAAQEALLNLLVASGHVRGTIDQLFDREHITPGQYNVLRILRGAHPLGYSRCEIAGRMIERAPDVTRLIDRLVRAGLAERMRSESDGRLSVTRITRRGNDLLDRLSPHVDAAMVGIGGRLGRQELRELSRLCEKLYGPDLVATPEASS